MEPYGGVPVFVDVDQPPNQFLISQAMCQSVISKREKTGTSNTVSHSYNSEASQFVPMTNQNQMSSAQAVTEDQAMLTGANSQCDIANVKPSGTKKAASDKADESQSLLVPVPRRIRCPECQRYTAENEEKMLRHIKKVHKGENPFQCYMCDYSTYNKSLFEEHVRIHQGIKPFKCSHCDYKSASKKNLKKHELIHRPNNPLKCRQCDFIGRHSKALQKHEETHSSADWLKFDSCKFQFQDLNAFKKHERTHKLKCKDCDFKTCSRPFLKRHMVKEHGLADDSVKRESFCCQICGWTSSTMAKILLHLIHHPKQEVDESVIDISTLRKHGIM